LRGIVETQFEPTRVFPAKGRIGLQAAGFLVGGGLYLLMLIVWFLLLVMAPDRPGHVQNQMAPGLIGGSSVVGIGLLARGIFLLRSVTRVVLDERGVTLEGFVSRQTVPWESIERIDREKKSQAMGQKSVPILKLVGAGEKKLAEIPETISDFEAMAGEVAARSAARRGKPTFDPAANEQRLKVKARKTKKGTLAALVFLLLMMGGTFVGGLYEEVHVRRYATEGAQAQGKIVRRFMVRVTPRLEYTFRDERGVVHSRETAMDQPAWDALDGETTVPVEYLKSDPEWNRVKGEEAGPSLGGMFLWLSGGGLLFFGVMFAFMLLGFDLKIDGGRTTLERHGEVLRSWGAAAAAMSAPIPSASAIPSAITPPMPAQAISMPVPDFAMPLAPAGALAMKRPKPAGIVALGVLAIVLGILGIGKGLVSMAVTGNRTITMPDGREMLLEAPSWAIYWNATDTVLAAALVVTGVGLLMMKEWARRLGIAVAVLQIASSLGAVVRIVVGMAQGPEVNGADSTMIAAANIGAIIGVAIGMIFPLVLAIILARGRTCEAFAGVPGAP
jgi:hypothetical protein